MEYRKVGLAAISLREGDELIDVHVTDGKRDIIMISHLGQCIRFDETMPEQREEYPWV